MGIDLDKEKTPSLEDRLTYEGMLIKNLLEYGIDIKNRTILLTGEVDDDMFSTLDLGMSYMERESKKAITIKISSFGGDIFSCFSIIGRINDSKCTIHTKGYGKIMSSATLILASGTGKRSISKFARYMWHEISYDRPMDRHTTNKHEIKIADQEWTLFCQYMESFSGTEAKFWRKKGEYTDWYIPVDELVELGAVDEVF